MAQTQPYQDVPMQALRMAPGDFAVDYAEDWSVSALAVRPGPSAVLLAFVFSLLAAVGFLSPAARAQQPAPFTQFVIFGDSFSDVGNCADATNAKFGIRYPGVDFNYDDGRFTDGPNTAPGAKRYAGVWSEQLASLLALPRAGASFNGGADYAFGGASTTDGASERNIGSNLTVTVANMGQQLDRYLAGNSPDPRALYSLWGGTNDLLDDDSDANVSRIAQRVGGLIRRLALAGARTILVPDVPPLGDAPGQAGDAQKSAALNQAASHYRDQLNAVLDAAQADFTTQNLPVRIYRLDVFDLFNRIQQNPAAYGFTNVTQGAQGQAVDADQYLAWDDLHPTTAGHYRIAAAAYTLLTGLSISHTHVLWNNTDGKVMLWSVAPGGAYTQNTFGPYTDGAPNTIWYAKSLATGPDGRSHLLWTNPDGRVILWTVDDAGSFTFQVYGPYTDGSPSTPWSATAVSVGADNLVHILWTNPDGRVILWNVDASFNFTLAVFGPYTDDGTPNTPWRATALASGPDNVSRLVWNNPDGRVILWNVDDSFNFSYKVYGPYTDGTPNTPWSAAAVSVGPDNMAHLLWNNPDGKVILWNVDTSFNFTYGVFGAPTDGSPSSAWGASALATGPDALSHILWTNPDNRVILWGVNSAFDFTLNVYGPLTDGAAQNMWSATAVSAGP